MMTPLNVVAAGGEKFYTYAFTPAVISAGRGFNDPQGGDMQPRQLVEDPLAWWQLARATQSTSNQWQVQFKDDPFTDFVQPNGWNEIDMEIEGYGPLDPVIWGGTTYITAAAQPGLWQYLDSQVGNTIGLNILGGRV